MQKNVQKTLGWAKAGARRCAKIHLLYLFFLTNDLQKPMDVFDCAVRRPIHSCKNVTMSAGRREGLARPWVSKIGPRNARDQNRYFNISFFLKDRSSCKKIHSEKGTVCTKNSQKIGVCGSVSAARKRVSSSGPQKSPRRTWLQKYENTKTALLATLFGSTCRKQTPSTIRD